jgi:hypothetical protein
MTAAKLPATTARRKADVMAYSMGSSQIKSAPSRAKKVGGKIRPHQVQPGMTPVMPLSRTFGGGSGNHVSAASRGERWRLKSNNVRLRHDLLDKRNNGAAHLRVSDKCECPHQSQAFGRGEKLIHVFGRLRLGHSWLRQTKCTRYTFEEKRHGHLKDLAQVL